MTKPKAPEIDAGSTDKASTLSVTGQIRDGFCRFMGGYVPVGEKVQDLDGKPHTCVATETFDPPL